MDKRALFILHEGIGSTIFNSQVLEHAKSMENLGIQFDILAFDTLKKTWKLSNKNLKTARQNNPEINIILKKGMNIYYPFSFVCNLISLIVFLANNKGKYLFLHGRADYTAFLGIVSKPFHGLPVYWDCRGDAVSELKDSLSRKSLLIRIIGHIYLVTFDRISAFVNCRYCSGAIFVSEALYELFKADLRTSNYQIIPCPVSEKQFYFAPELRLKMREALDIKSTDRVFLYSGSMVAYQAIDQQYDQYKALLKDPANVVIIATSDLEAANGFFKNLRSPQFRIISVSFQEMNAYYNLSDFAFLMREHKQLNYVASPTKFGEYCLTGLPVIMNDTVNQAYLISKKLHNYINYQTITHEVFSDLERATISIESKAYYSRAILNVKYLALYKYSQFIKPN